jgi:hypothetical protein
MLYDEIRRAVAASEVRLPSEQGDLSQAVDDALSVFGARALLVS